MVATTRRKLLALLGATTLAAPLAACGTVTMPAAPEQGEGEAEAKPAAEAKAN